jgi:single-strand DNA-binding protein
MSETERVTLVGNLTADPELRSTPTGLEVANLRIAVTPRTRQDDGSWTQGETSFHTITVGRDQATNATETLTKGARVIVVGRPKQRSWQLKTRSSRRQVLLVSVAVDALGRHSPGSARSGSCSASSGTTTGWSSRTPWASPCTPPTSCSGVAIRCWRGPGCRGFASTICVTVPPRCCLALASTPRS